MNVLPSATSADEKQRAASVAVMPIGSFEQHGDHLPLVTDTVVACVIAGQLASSYELLLLPPVTITCSHEHEGFHGTVSIRSSTLIAVIEDVAASLRRSGIDKLVLVNGHGGNHVLSNVVQEANVGGRRMALFPGREHWDAARDAASMVSSRHDDMHGGELETSILLHATPELVRSGFRWADHEANDRPHLLITGMTEYTTTGIIGRPSVATPAKGKVVVESLVSSFADVLKVLMA